MSRDVTGVSEDLEDECRTTMYHDNMDLYRLMVHTQQVEESRRRKRGREGKKLRPSDQASSSTGDKSVRKKGNDRNAQRDRKSCGKCGRLHGGECMVGSNACYGCDKSGHMIRDCPHVKNQAKADTHPRPNPTAAAEPPKRNMFYALKGRQEQGKEAKFEWSETCENSFQELKDRLTLDPVLTLPRSSEGNVVYYDASRVGLGCILMQDDKVIAYASK
ncbi:uncharacterized protein LOC107016733 [Solanum pennellii]|uniref:Uncharacterized protein LOC107016733 n=1 Tax=Solanum pennellii TaxID=28526 RepID=A0ABM1GL01_SOLPN|nr:uncharacterized protein LOC107016733 [Solanum pennellii]